MGIRSEDTNLNDLQKDEQGGENAKENIDLDEADVKEKAKLNQDEEAPIDAEKFDDEEFEGIGEEGTEDDIEEVISELKSKKARLADENVKLTNELEVLKDRLMRTSAEYENFRKRTTREKEGIYTDACEDVLKNMFPVLDNLERAFGANGSIEDLKKGVEMTIRQFKDSLERLNVEEISNEGEFDPNLHNAVMHMEDETLGKNVIVEVFQKGYKKGNKVLRHSMVKVAN